MYCGHRAPTELGRLRHAAPFDEPKNEYDPQRCRHLVEYGEGAPNQIVRVVIVGVDPFDVLARGRQHRFWPPAATANVRPRDVDGDPGDPGGKSWRLPYRVHVTEELFEDLLHYIFVLGIGAEDSPHQAMDHRRESVVEKMSRTRSSALDELEQTLVGSSPREDHRRVDAVRIGTGCRQR